MNNDQVQELLGDFGRSSGVGQVQQAEGTADSGEQRGIEDTTNMVDNFNEIYKSQLDFIDCHFEESQANKLKLPIYTKWINDLTEHNKVLVAAVHELEEESNSRCLLLEKKLQEEKEDPRCRRISNLENDVQNLMELIRRAQVEGCWRIDGLQFREVDMKEIFNDTRNVKPNINIKLCVLKSNNMTEEQVIKIPMSRISFLTDNDNASERHILSGNELEAINASQRAAECQDETPSQIELEDLRCKFEMLRRQNHDLNKQVMDTKVLVLEVADKHDQILRLKTEITGLEERLRQANMQTHFKDDVIKELRRECRSISKTTESKRSVSECRIPQLEELDIGHEIKSSNPRYESFVKELGFLIGLTGDENEISEDVIFNRVLKLSECSKCHNRENFPPNHENVSQLLENQNFNSEHEISNVNNQICDLKEMKSILNQLKQTMVASETEGGPGEDLGDVNKILVDANQMLIDLRSEIEGKDLSIKSGEEEILKLKDSLTLKQNGFDELQKALKEERVSHQKLIIDLENSIRMHLNKIYDLGDDKLKLENELSAIKISKDPPSDVLSRILDERNQLEIECNLQKTTIENLKTALESLKRDKKDTVSSIVSSNSAHSAQQQQSQPRNQQGHSIWSWWRTVHDV